MTEIQQNIQQGSPLARSTVITSIKFAAASKQSNPESIDNLIPSLLDCLKDSDINIKKNVLVSLTAVAHNHYALLKLYIEELLVQSYEEVTFRPELVRTVDLGPFKH
eukprot:CAMPEP_0168315556 /NCGR_PEP_ID=MMETSP0210-20121227/11668_1 /TAXON_ID=40633 /ORGANISM="Condylostoma magnum, Strain COL2" /LENGTH=106 /DNA_ID=CAMNT_0008289449 /DNA_START=2842 /DNA_END=3162 /DNA_ORIENTATION=+